MLPFAVCAADTLRLILDVSSDYSVCIRRSGDCGREGKTSAQPWLCGEKLTMSCLPENGWWSSSEGIIDQRDKRVAH